jgi:hypothetical protein
MKIHHSIFDFHGAFRPVIRRRPAAHGPAGESGVGGATPGAAETVMGKRAALQAGEGVLVEVHEDVLGQRRMDPLY